MPFEVPSRTVAPVSVLFWFVCVLAAPRPPRRNLFVSTSGDLGDLAPLRLPGLAHVGCFGETCNLREAAPKKTSAGKTLDSSTNTIPTREEEEEAEEEEGTIAVIRLQALISSILSLSPSLCIGFCLVFASCGAVEAAVCFPCFALEEEDCP